MVSRRSRTTRRRTLKQFVPMLQLLEVTLDEVSVGLIIPRSWVRTHPPHRKGPGQQGYDGPVIKGHDGPTKIVPRECSRLLCSTVFRPDNPSVRSSALRGAEPASTRGHPEAFKRRIDDQVPLGIYQRRSTTTFATFAADWIEVAPL